LLNKLKVEIAKANVETLKSGTKVEYLDYIKAQIAKLDKDIDILNSRLNEYTILSPVRGIVYHMFSGDTLVIIGDTTEYVLHIPIPWRDRNRVFASQNVKLTVPDVDEINEASILKLDKKVYPLNNDQMFLGVATVENRNGRLMSGLPVACSIECDKVLLKDYLNEVFSNIFN